MNLKVKFTSKLIKAKALNEIVFVKNKNIKSKDIKTHIKSLKDNSLFQEQLFIQKEFNNKNYIFVNCKKLSLSSDYENIGSKLFDYLKNNKLEYSYINSSKANINNIQL